MDPFVFPWDVPVHQLVGLSKFWFTNTVAQVGVVHPVTGNMYPLLNRKPSDPMDIEYDVIDFSMIAIRNADERSKAQRYITPLNPPHCILALMSGILIATGSDHATIAYESLLAAAVIMRKELIPGNSPFKLVFFNIVNQPFCGCFDFGINLMLLTSLNSGYCISWENDTFPGAIIRSKPDRTTITVFASGMMICTGEVAVAMMPRIQKLVDFILAHPDLHVPLSTEDIRKREKKIQERLVRMQTMSIDPEPEEFDNSDVCNYLDIPLELLEL